MAFGLTKQKKMQVILQKQRRKNDVCMPGMRCGTPV